MEEPPCAKSRERVVFFSPLLIAVNTRAGVISPPVPRGVGAQPHDPAPLWGAPSEDTPTSTRLILTPRTELGGRNQRRGHGPHPGLSPPHPAKNAWKE